MLWGFWEMLSMRAFGKGLANTYKKIKKPRKGGAGGGG